MFNLITILKRIKYQFYNLYNSEKSIPSDYKLFERRDTSYQHFINKLQTFVNKNTKHCKKYKNELQKYKIL